MYRAALPGLMQGNTSHRCMYATSRALSYNPTRVEANRSDLRRRPYVLLHKEFPGKRHPSHTTNPKAEPRSKGKLSHA